MENEELALLIGTLLAGLAMCLALRFE